MRPIYGRGIHSHMAGEREVSKLSAPEHTENGSAATKYHKLIQRRSVSLDLHTAFKTIKISQEVTLDICQDCKAEKCKCPAFTPETPCSSVLSTPTNTEPKEDEIPDLVENTALNILYPPVLSLSDEEADWKVAAICSAPVYYWVRA